VAAVNVSTDTGPGKPGKVRDLGPLGKTQGIYEKSGKSKGNL